jgi:hypothetical protein
MAALLCAVLLLGLMAGCGAKDSIVGTWSAETKISVLGIDQNGGDADAEITFSFLEDGNGSMDVDIQMDLPDPEERSFQYSVEGDALTLEYDDQQKNEFTFVLDGDTLKLDGRVSLELKRQK